MKFRALILPAVMMVALAGCAPEPAAPANPSSSPSQPAPPATTSPTPTPTVDPISLPADCEALVPTSTVHREFSPQFDPVAFVPHPEDEIGQSFAERDGLICTWTIPRSEAFVAVYAAESAAASDAAQIADWRSAGFTECPGILDACFSEDFETMVGQMSIVYALADGYEIQARTSAGSIDSLLVLAQEAATNMGYN